MKAVIKLFLFNSLFFISCNVQNGVQESTKKNILTHKEFMRSLSFNGLVKEKKYCESCNYNKYQITLSLDSISIESVPIGFLSFQPYYFFSSNKEITVSILKGFYDDIEVNKYVSKIGNTDYLVFKNTTYRILNESRYKWMP